MANSARTTTNLLEYIPYQEGSSLAGGLKRQRGVDDLQASQEPPVGRNVGVRKNMNDLLHTYIIKLLTPYWASIEKALNVQEYDDNASPLQV